MKKFVSLFVAALMCVSVMADTKRVYCKMEQSWWTVNEQSQPAAIAAYSYSEGGGELAPWPGTRMTAVEGEAGVWYIDVDAAAYPNIIFVRVSAEGDLADWGAKTGNLTIPADDKDLFTITTAEPVWGEPGCTGEWSKYVQGQGTDPDPKPENITLYFVNAEDWSPVQAYVYGDESMNWEAYKPWPGEAMTATGEKAMEKDVYSYTFPAKYSTIIFNNKVGDAGKQSANLSWDASKPYYYDGEWFASLADISPVTPAKFYIQGQGGILGNWDNPIKSTEDTYTLSLAAGDYKLKVVVGEEWLGYDKLTEKAEGLVPDKDQNICFTLSAAGEVKVTYTAEVFKLEGEFAPAVTVADGYYLVGSMTDWEAQENYLFTANEGQEGEYTLDVTLAEGDEFKVAYSEKGVLTWYPAEGENFVVTAAYAGAKTVYFRPEGNEGWTILNGMVYIEPNEGASIDNTAVEGTAVKTIVNGQLVIRKNGVNYNAAGQTVR